VEGWAVGERNGQRVIFAHGWMDVGGELRDETPHHHVLAGGYFEARRLPADEVIAAPLVPLCPCVDPEENPGPVALYMRGAPAYTAAYVAAEEAATKFCEQRGGVELM
jgi:hypothetical protein